MQIDYIRKKKVKPEINADYVHKNVDKYYLGLKELLNDLNNPYMQKQRSEILRNAEREIDAKIDAEGQKASALEIEAFMPSEEQKIINKLKKIFCIAFK